MTKRRGVWAEHEMGGAKLGDARRVERAVKIADARQKRPQGTLTAGLGNKAEVKAGYRFYESQEIDAEALIAGHAARMEERVRQSGSTVVLAIQDTMHVESQGRDVWVHSTMVATPERVAQGLMQQQVWERETRGGKKKAERRVLKVEDKESNKWLVSIQAAGELKKRLGGASRVVSVGDRENDMYDAFLQAQTSQVDVLVRAAQDRRIAEDAEKKLWDYVLTQPVAGEMDVVVGRNGQREGRTARLAIRFTTVTLCPPQRRSKSEDLKAITLTAVHAIELNADGLHAEPPIEWLLLTTVDTLSFADACERVSWYACRWLIEMFHKILKSGCQIEERQFETFDNFRRYLSIDSIVAWRVLHLTLLGRQTPNLPCSVVLELHEWQSLFAYTHKSLTIPDQPPTLNQAVLWIAMLGGFLARNADGPPGTTVIWRGIQRLADIASSFIIFKNVGNG